MKININEIQRYVVLTISNACIQLKLNLAFVWKQIRESATQGASDLRIRVTLPFDKRWEGVEDPKKHHVSIKFLTSKIEDLGNTPKNERYKKMLSTYEICLLLRCWEWKKKRGC